MFHGIPEGKQEDASALIIKLVGDKLKLPEFNAEDISCCYRMGRLSNPDRCRPILLKVRDISLRGRIWAAKTNFKGSGITVSEFLTKLRHDAFLAARQRYGVTKCWTRDGIIFVMGTDGVRHRVSCLAELDKLKVPSVVATAPKHKPAVATVKEAAAAKLKRTAAAKK